MQNYMNEWVLKLLKKIYVIYLRLYPSIYELFGNMYVCRIILYFRIQIKQELQEVWKFSKIKSNATKLKIQRYS